MTRNGGSADLYLTQNIKKRTGIITFRVSNDLWDVFTKFAKGYREFELNKALALPTGYSLRFYMLMSGQVYPWIYPLKT